MTLKQITKRILKKDREFNLHRKYFNKYDKYSFMDGKCVTFEQFEASITRLYHTVEKSLAFENYVPGHGRDNIDMLLLSLEQYSSKFSYEEFFYRTALSVLKEYIAKSKEYGVEEIEIATRLAKLPGEPNDCGGIICFEKPDAEINRGYNFEEMCKQRHSIRHFSNIPLNIETVREAIELAQYTPSACNRQGWKSYIVNDKNKMEQILNYQNGNKGFGNEFDMLLLIVGDLRYFNRSRELYQVYVDGGMYAMRVVDSLYFKGIASIPLSASLSEEQEKGVRRIMKINEAEVPIMFIGIGNYPEKCITTRSARKKANYDVIG